MLTSTTNRTLPWGTCSQGGRFMMAILFRWKDLCFFVSRCSFGIFLRVWPSLWACLTNWPRERVTVGPRTPSTDGDFPASGQMQSLHASFWSIVIGHTRKLNLVTFRLPNWILDSRATHLFPDAFKEWRRPKFSFPADEKCNSRAGSALSALNLIVQSLTNKGLLQS